MKSVVTFILMVFLLIPNQAYSALVDYGTYSYDTANGFNWLHLTETAGISKATVDAMISPGGSLEGWRFATGLEFEIMATALFTDPSTSDSTDFEGYSYDTNGVVPQIITQLGSISGSSFDTQYGLLADVVEGKDNIWWSAALHPGDAAHPGQDWIVTHRNWESAASWHPNMGSFLVTANVPIPGAILLFGSGLLGLVGIRRKKQ